MPHATLLLFEGRSTPAMMLFSPAVLILLQTAIWDWQSSERMARRSMLFGVRVGPEFITSASGDSIRKRFRFRMWLLSGVLSLTYALVAWRSSPGLDSVVVSLLALPIVSMLGNLVLFSLANGETRRLAAAFHEPTTRTAALFVEEQESSAWLSVLDWIAILLPLGIPIVTLVVVIICWNRFPQHGDPFRELRDTFFSGSIGIYTAGTYFALRYRARSNDWAPTPLASRRYRATLGWMISGLFSFMIFKSCWLSVMPLLQGSRFASMDSHFRFSLSAGICVLLVLVGMRLQLKRNLARESSDPMADDCWKWGYFYYNPRDSALVVPTRSGTGFSYNYASRAIWAVGAICVGVTLFTFISFFMRR
jgi:uncharacterized membrane protein